MFLSVIEEWGSGGDGSTNGVKYTDPLADPKSCKRDIPLLQELRTNTIRVYAVHPEADHDECMEMLDDAGIYVVADLSEPATSIVRSDPKWDLNLYERYTDVIDSLAGYSNVLGFFAGNEVTNNHTNTDASAFVKAAVRDMKKYIKDKDYRPMGVGYATNDDAEIRDDLVDYFYCGSEEEIVDFWGYNIYSWCGKSSFKESGFDKVVKDFTDFSVPVFFAEYGCNEVKTRPFTEVEAIYGPKMTPVLSGGIVYMYFQEDNDYGKPSLVPRFKYILIYSQAWLRLRMEVQSQRSSRTLRTSRSKWPRSTLRAPPLTNSSQRILSFTIAQPSARNGNPTRTFPLPRTRNSATAWWRA